MMIWEDEISLGWSPEEEEGLREMGGWEASLVRPLPGGAHFRPYAGGEGSVLMLWEALHADLHVPDPPPAHPEIRRELFAELTLRALRTMVPSLENYLGPGARKAVSSPCPLTL